MQDERIVYRMHYPGSLNSFEGLMERLDNECGWREWVCTEGEMLRVNRVEPDEEWERKHKPPNRRSWEVCFLPEQEETYFDADFGPAPGPPHYAGIEAYGDQPDGTTTVVFWNGYTPRDRSLLPPKIDRALLDQCFNRIIEEGKLSPVGADEARETSTEQTAVEPVTPSRGAKIKNRGARGPNLDTPEKVARARLIIEREDRTKTVACRLARVDIKTFNRWHNHEDVLRAMKRLGKTEDPL